VGHDVFKIIVALIDTEKEAVRVVCEVVVGCRDVLGYGKEV
jgi:hypothetical protein